MDTPDVDALAQEIRRVDGDNSLGGALAEALLPFMREALTREREECAKMIDSVAAAYRLGLPKVTGEYHVLLATAAGDMDLAAAAIRARSDKPGTGEVG